MAGNRWRVTMPNGDKFTLDGRLSMVTAGFTANALYPGWVLVEAVKGRKKELVGGIMGGLRADLPIGDEPTIPLSNNVWLHGGADCRCSAVSIWRITIAELKRRGSNMLAEEEINSAKFAHLKEVPDALRFLKGERNDVTAVAYKTIFGMVKAYKGY